MNAMSSFVLAKRHSAKAASIAALFAALLVPACVAPNSAPQQVKASNPSVTYKYRGDQELLQANQNAMTYCSQYRSAARTKSITDSDDGGKTVVFECDAMPPVVMTGQPYNPNVVYSYRSDQELFDCVSQRRNLLHEQQRNASRDVDDHHQSERHQERHVPMRSALTNREDRNS